MHPTRHPTPSGMTCCATPRCCSIRRSTSSPSTGCAAATHSSHCNSSSESPPAWASWPARSAPTRRGSTVRSASRACNLTHPEAAAPRTRAATPLQPGCNPMHPTCNPTHPACNSSAPRRARLLARPRRPHALVLSLAGRLVPRLRLRLVGPSACNPVRWRLQPYAREATALCDGGCNPMRWRLQPYAMEAATLCGRSCNPMR